MGQVVPTFWQFFEKLQGYVEDGEFVSDEDWMQLLAFSNGGDKYAAAQLLRARYFRRKGDAGLALAFLNTLSTILNRDLRGLVFVEKARCKDGLGYRKQALDDAGRAMQELAPVPKAAIVCQEMKSLAAKLREELAAQPAPRSRLQRLLDYVG